MSSYDDYMAQHRAMIDSLDSDVKAPKKDRQRAGNRMSTRTFVNNHSQPVGMRRSGFQGYVQNPENKKEVKQFMEDLYYYRDGAVFDSAFINENW